MSALRVGGLVPLTTVDWPGALAAVVFCQGCPWRCPYCHNPHLLPARGARMVPWAEVRRLLERRRGLLDGVVFSGGEPTVQPALAAALDEVRGLGFRTGLHTAGPYPRRLAALLPRLDWVALDVKAPLARYDDLTGVPGSGRRLAQSLGLVLERAARWELRTTVDPDLLDRGALLALARELAARGVRRWILQRHRPPPGAGPPARPDPLDEPGLLEALRAHVPALAVRGA